MAGRKVRPRAHEGPEWVSRRFLGHVEAAVDHGIPMLFVFGEADRYHEDFVRARDHELGRILDGAGDLVTTGRGPRPRPRADQRRHAGRRARRHRRMGGEGVDVVHVIDSLAAAGGAENRLVDEVVALADRHPGTRQAVVRLYARDALQPRLEAAGVPVLALGLDARRAARTWPLAARRLRAVLRERRPDVVHTALASANLVGQLAAAPLGIPVVSSFNRTGDPALQPDAGWRGRVMQAVGRAAARRGDVWWRAVSDHARDPRCPPIG